MLVALLHAGCGGRDRVAPVGAGERAAHAVASQDRLPPAVASTPASVAAEDEAEARSREACRHWIAMTCVQASLRSEAICRLARCEQVAGFWIAKVPHEQVEEDLRRRGY